jgi:site-specific DNA recombinase
LRSSRKSESPKLAKPSDTHASGLDQGRSTPAPPRGLLRERIVELKADREKAQAAYDHAASQMLPSASIHPERLAAFSKLMSDLLDNGETPARKAYLRTVIVGDKSVTIVGSKEAIGAAILGKRGLLQNVRGLGPKWRARHDSNV